MLKGLSFDQTLRVHCIELTGSVQEAKDAYDWIKQSQDEVKPVEPVQPSPDELLEEAEKVALEQLHFLELGGHSINLCRDNGILTVKDLAGWDIHAVKTIFGMGRKSFQELEAVLEKRGLNWGMWESPSYIAYRDGKKWTRR